MQAGATIQGAIGLGQVIAGDYLTGGTAIVNALSKVIGVTQAKYEKSKIPPSTIGHTANGDINFAMHNNRFTFYKMSIKSEYARIIDEFFTKFGYKVNRLKIPNITGRQFYNYVKTIDSIVEGDTIPEKYLNEYKKMLDNGITFWHNTQNFLDYSVNNTIV